MKEFDSRQIFNKGFCDKSNDQVSAILKRADDFSNNNINLEDLTSLKTYTIDDEDSEEKDDAISLQRRGNNFIIWIHIADPCPWIEEESPIDIEARNRGTSIYLTNKTSLMLPIRLIENLLTLRAGRRTTALSASVELDEEGKICNYKIIRSIIKPLYELTYEDADELIDYAPLQEDDLYILSKLLEKRKKWRIKNGAVSIDQSRSRIILSGNKPILKIIDPSPSRQLVSESMILMGTIAALYGIENNLPMPYRAQEGFNYSNKGKIDSNLDIDVYNSILKSSFSRSYLSSSPHSHSSLGLKAYVQASSPLRRYSDLIAHRQIYNNLENNTIINNEDMKEMISQITITSRQALEITREDNRHWLSNYLRENPKIVYSAYFIKWFKLNDKICLLRITELHMDLICKLTNCTSLKLGDKINILTNIDELSEKIIPFIVVS